MLKKIILTICFVCFFVLQRCTAKDLQPIQFTSDFPEKEDVIATAIYLSGPRVDDANLFDVNGPSPLIIVIGNMEKAEESIGIPLEPLKVVESMEMVEKIVNEYDSALSNPDAENLYYQAGMLLQFRIAFITKDSIHIRSFDFDEEFVFGEKIQSKKLMDYFEKLGLVSKIAISHIEKYSIPSKEETIAILVLPYKPNQIGPCPPIAIIGDKEQAETLLYGDKRLTERWFRKSLEPNKVFGREYLEKVWDIYSDRIKDDPNGIKAILNSVNNGSIVFITENKAYKRSFLFDVDNCRVLDDSFSSGDLWSLFKELGLIDLLQGSDDPVFKEELIGARQEYYKYHPSQKNPEQ